ncbi:hypothetical protein GOP47_0011384 [Adiantum capillus-veneris]|uniref:Tify domain-containing protein n=1 Tax=Adiantum capillus-veneris TaxID=13818 RepID=A0A9D4USU8_ADICA|nr:hypothetical protein GOP47_0011384 [Adiantum capillus-veneris]
MKAQYAGGAGDRDRALLADTSSAPLSLKARETASLSLKRIFERQLQQQQRSLDFTVHSSSAITNDSDVNIGDSHDWQVAIKPAAASDQPDLDLKLAPPSTSYTMVNNHIADRHVIGSGPLTMFYSGTVCVYEDISATKAQAILLLASGISEGDSYRASYTNNSARIMIKSRPPTPSVLSVRNAETAAAAPAPATSSRPAKACRRSQAELPFARKASLTRFLEKRKERIEEKPVAANKSTTSSTERPPKRPCSASSLHQS